MTAE
jgi:hypothetical protein